MKPYNEFLKEKQIIHKSTGFNVDENDINPVLFPHQNALTRYALRKGRSAILADTGLGKTLMELEFARIVTLRTNKPVLIVMPLYVAYQTLEMAESLLGYHVTFADETMDICPGQSIYVTNYEKLHKFEGADFGALVFDESSIFKGEGKFFERAKTLTKNMPFVLCASATPSPNSIEEMGRQAEVLGIMTVPEMKATFFINRQEGKKGQRQGWQLKPYAQEQFYKWLASWAMAIKKPGDLGFSDKGYDLPPLTITPIFIDGGYIPEGQLLFTGLKGISDRSSVRKMTLEPKCQMATEIIGDDPDQWIVWCGLNPEATRMKQLLGDKSINVQGSDSTDRKVKALQGFSNNEIQVLISKTKICGHGSNFQNAHKMIFVGLSDSWEAFYQAIKRIHRFKQDTPCEVYVILAEEERQIWDNVIEKGNEAEIMTKYLVENASQYQRAELDLKSDETTPYIVDEIKNDQFRIMLGDSSERLREIEDDSIGLSVYSPPFEDLFVYSNTERDLGNSATKEDFYTHYGYIVGELLRVTMPGRKTVVHVADIHARKSKDGFLGLKDFSGNVIQLYIDHGWHYQGRIPIAKNPQATAIRLKAHELMFATMKRDAARLMPVQPDYFLVFTKPGKNAIPVLPMENGEMNEDTWIDWAGNTWLNGLGEKLEDDSLTKEDFLAIAEQVYEHYKTGNPIWDDIRETKVLQHKGKHSSRLGEKDTKHICPLQLDPVERAVKLWSNPGETVLTPFMGIGTEVYQAVMFERFGIGIELKPEYFYKAKENIEEAVRLSKQEDLFSLAGIEV